MLPWQKFVFSALLFISLMHCSESAFLSSSKLDQCVLDGEDEEMKLECEQKFTVTLTLENGQDSTETLDVAIKDVERTEDGRKVRLAEPIKITMKKSRPLIRYPVYYLQDFNHAPYEQAVYVEPDLLGTTCLDDPKYIDVSCGWVKRGNAIVDHSQGFCCDCNLADYFSADKTNRGALSCDFFGKEVSSAHCLRMNDIWWSGYSIGPAETFYVIEVTMTKTFDDKSTKSDTLEIGPEQMSQRSADDFLLARLVGDFATFRQQQVLEYHKLILPSYPWNDPFVKYDNFRKWMVVPDTMYTHNGHECNKIGISYYGFRNNQANRCSLPIGACLAWQPKHIYESELEKYLSGKKTDYLLSGMGSFTFHPNMENNVHYLMKPVVQKHTTLVSLTFTADDVSFITNRSPGIIDNIEINQGFRALSKEGYMKVHAVNTGHIWADFSVTVTECDDGLKPMQAQTATIDSFEKHTFYFHILAQYQFNAYYTCTVRLYDSLSHLEDEEIVEIWAWERGIDRGEQGGEPDIPDLGDKIDPTAQERGDCDTFCTSIFDIACVILHGCFEQLLKFVITVVGIIAAGIIALCILAACAKSGLLTFVIKSSINGLSFMMPKMKSKEAKENKKDRKMLRDILKISALQSAAKGNQDRNDDGGMAPPNTMTGMRRLSKESIDSDNESTAGGAPPMTPSSTAEVKSLTSGAKLSKKHIRRKSQPAPVLEATMKTKNVISKMFLNKPTITSRKAKRDAAAQPSSFRVIESFSGTDSLFAFGPLSFAGEAAPVQLVESAIQNGALIYYHFDNTDDKYTPWCPQYPGQYFCMVGRGQFTTSPKLERMVSFEVVTGRTAMTFQCKDIPEEGPTYLPLVPPVEFENIGIFSRELPSSHAGEFIALVPKFACINKRWFRQSKAV